MADWRMLERVLEFRVSDTYPEAQIHFFPKRSPKFLVQLYQTNKFCAGLG
jgi:hypothetical protein